MNSQAFGLPGKPDGTAAEVEQQQCKNKSSFPRHSTPDLKALGQGKSKNKVMKPVLFIFFPPLHYNDLTSGNSSILMHAEKAADY